MGGNIKLHHCLSGTTVSSINRVLRNVCNETPLSISISGRSMECPNGIVRSQVEQHSPLKPALHSRNAAIAGCITQQNQHQPHLHTVVQQSIPQLQQHMAPFDLFHQPQSHDLSRTGHRDLNSINTAQQLYPLPLTAHYEAINTANSSRPDRVTHLSPHNHPAAFAAAAAVAAVQNQHHYQPHAHHHGVHPPNSVPSVAQQISSNQLSGIGESLHTQNTMYDTFSNLLHPAAWSSWYNSSGQGPMAFGYGQLTASGALDSTMANRLAGYTDCSVPMGLATPQRLSVAPLTLNGEPLLQEKLERTTLSNGFSMLNHETGSPPRKRTRSAIHKSHQNGQSFMDTDSCGYAVPNLSATTVCSSTDRARESLTVDQLFPRSFRNLDVSTDSTRKLKELVASLTEETVFRRVRSDVKRSESNNTSRTALFPTCETDRDAIKPNGNNQIPYFVFKPIYTEESLRTGYSHKSMAKASASAQSMFNAVDNMCSDLPIESSNQPNTTIVQSVTSSGNLKSQEEPTRYTDLERPISVGKRTAPTDRIDDGEHNHGKAIAPSSAYKTIGGCFPFVQNTYEIEENVTQPCMSDSQYLEAMNFNFHSMQQSSGINSYGEQHGQSLIPLSDKNVVASITYPGVSNDHQQRAWLQTTTDSFCPYGPDSVQSANWPSSSYPQQSTLSTDSGIASPPLSSTEQSQNFCTVAAAAAAAVAAWSGGCGTDPSRAQQRQTFSNMARPVGVLNGLETGASQFEPSAHHTHSAIDLGHLIAQHSSSASIDSTSTTAYCEFSRFLR
ncbi:uncharacterized protein DEA37_0008405 [Paragonimus westermani]|uniref:Uncharacterized protein n=1 Tax=Paragonimus westermani TaxID=34504 RepID=A0A5J4NMV4_9TREM|nr:uncharacterized protein DEA37_0008405 [Paragonimus westermani]